MFRYAVREEEFSSQRLGENSKNLDSFGQSAYNLLSKRAST